MPAAGVAFNLIKRVKGLDVAPTLPHCVWVAAPQGGRPPFGPAKPVPGLMLA
jgi:hypothetical protein